MPTVLLDGHDERASVEEILRPFAGKTTSTHPGLIRAGPPEPRIISRLVRSGNGQDASLTVRTWMVTDAKGTGAREACACDADRCEACGSETDQTRAVEPALVRREIKRQLYTVLSEWSGWRFPWGSLTGIRPTRIADEALRACGGNDASAAILLNRFWQVSPAKAKLAVEVLQRENALLGRLPPEQLLVYVGVPFCPTRCAYCSFITHDAPRQAARLDAYVDAVLEEARVCTESVLPTVAALYIGGGTPSSLPADTLSRLLAGLVRVLPLAPDAEMTFEAGRPDTLDRPRLAAIRDSGFTRLCINPQTFDDRTLRRIHRQHTGEQTRTAFALAREASFARINMDLIAGLPGESAEYLERSLNALLELAPEEITVHALARKRAADLGDDHPVQPPDPLLETAVEMAHRKLSDEGYQPYYLYRQKEAVGGLENVGFARGGDGCLYNVGMMSDQRPVLGLGSGAVSKRIIGNQVERIVNSKDLNVYLKRAHAQTARQVAFFGQ